MNIHYSANTYTFISQLEFQQRNYESSRYMIPYEKTNDNIKDINLDILYYGTVFDDMVFDDMVFDDDDIKDFFIEDEKENTVFCSICHLLWL